MRNLILMSALALLPCAGATSVSLSSGFGDALADLNAGLGLLALEGEYDLGPQWSLNAGLGYVGALYVGAGGQFHFDSTAQGPFLGARAGLFSGVGLSALSLNLYGGYRTLFPQPQSALELSSGSHLQLDVLGGVTPFYQSSADQPGLNGFRVGFSFGVRLGLRFPDPVPARAPESEPLPVSVR